MTVSFYLTRPKAKGETSIFARISYSGYQLKYYTPEKINPKFWSKETKLAKQTDKFKEYPEFNQRLNNWKSDAANIFRQWVNNHKGTIPNPSTLKTLLDKELKKVEPELEKNKTFFGFFENLIKLTESGERLQPITGKPYSKATVHVYKNTFNRLIEFAAHSRRNIDFNTITVDFYTDFTGYLSKRLKLASNTIGKDIKTIKTILNEATERGLNTNLQYKSRKFSVTSENTDAIYLTSEELQKIENLDLSKNKRLENVRDLFLIGCYTGLRFSDCSALTSKNIKDGFIEITQTKTGAPVVIPVHHSVKKIMDKYEGKLPTAISNQKTNEYLKEIGQIKPDGHNKPILACSTSKTLTKGGVKVITNYKKWELLCTHTARRSFATNEYLAGTPTITIMAITGHKTEKAFLRYIKLTPTEHAKLLKQHWQQRNELKAV
jgi:integrase